MVTAFNYRHLCCRVAVGLVWVTSGCNPFVKFTPKIEPSSETVRSRQIAGRLGEATGCELTLALRTRDNRVGSHPVCIKRLGAPVDIPQHIALWTAYKVDRATNKRMQDDNQQDAQFTANKLIYCDSGLSDFEDGNALCVWNRRFYDNHPIDFILATTRDGTTPPLPATPPLSTVLSMVRVLRNGRTIYTWTPAAGQQDQSELRIPGRTIAAPEYFKEPVDLGLYLLSSGVDEAKAAVADAVGPATLKWQTTLAKAAHAAAMASAPPEARQFAQCVEAKLKYIRDLAGVLAATDDTSRETWQSEADKELKIINDLGASAKKTTSLVPLTVNLATEEVITGKARASVDGITLKPDDIVAFFDASREHVTLRQFTKQDAIWAPVTVVDGKLQVLPNAGAPAALEPFAARVIGGKFASETFLVTPGKSGDLLSGASIEQIVQGASCNPPDVAEAHQAYLTALKVVVGAPTVKKVGEVTQAASALAQKLNISATELSSFVKEQISRLPTSARTRVEQDVAWLRQLDEELAAVMDVARSVAESGPAVQVAVKSAIHDPAAQLRAYRAFAGALPTEDKLYSTQVPNPVPPAGEHTLPMTLLRPRQMYYLLAWNAVPIPVSPKSQVKVEPRIENLIPIIDLVGWHWQTGLPYVSVGGLGVGLFGTRETVKNAASVEETSAFNVGPQLNMSAAGFRIGGAYLLHKAEGCHSMCYWDERNWRFLVGADLIRLITGKDTAVDSDNSTGDGESATSN